MPIRQQRFLVILTLFWILILPSSLLYAESEPLKIGLSLHLTGEWAREGNAMLEGARLAAEELNKMGGAAGRAITVIAEDNQAKAGPTSAGAKKMLEIDQIHAALISSMTEVNFCGSLFERAKVPLITLWDSSPEMESMGEYIFGIGPWTPDTGERSARFAFEKLQLKNAVIINTNSRWSLSVSKFFRNKFTELGGTIVSEVSLNPDEVDFRSVLTNLRNLAPQALYVPLEFNIPLFLKQLHTAKLPSTIITSDLLTADTLRSLGSAADGIYHSQLAEINAPLTKHLEALYRKQFAREAELINFTAWGYDGVRIIAEAVKKAGLDPKKIKEAIYTIRDLPGASATISFNERGSAPMHSSIYQVQNGKLVLTER